MALYDPPASINDFGRRPAIEQQLRTEWDATVRSFIAETKSGSNGPVSGLFFDQLADTSGVPDPAPAGVPWNGFPQLLTNWFATQPVPNQEKLANSAAESLVTTSSLFGFFKKDGSQYVPIPITYRRQDEYCEWHVTKSGNAITRMSFTCEPPEYWSYLADKDLTLVLELYQELLHDASIQKDALCWPDDVYSAPGANGSREILYRRGAYNPWNEWNTTKGVVHLTHWANSLAAEVQLASDGSLGWNQPPGGVDPHRLICCAGFGGVNRSSDPKIGASVFSLARQGLSIALANPIGLYMQRFELAGLRDPGGARIADAVTWVRRSANGQNVLRFEVAPPAGANYTLDQCTLDGERLLFGGQIARLVTMSLFAIAKQIPGAVATPAGQCSSSCCPYPTNGQFFGSFRNDGKPCNQRSAQEWARNLRDVADLAPHPLMPMTAMVKEHADVPLSTIFTRIRGRSLEM
jgi:hypothetical protein